MFGWRATNWIGLYAGLSAYVHEAMYAGATDAYGNTGRALFYGRATVIDVPVVRLFLPVSGRFQPFVDLGAGVTFVNRVRDDPSFSALGHGRFSLGFDAWVARRTTLGVLAGYRLLGMADDSDADDVNELGHQLQLGLELGFHF